MTDHRTVYQREGELYQRLVSREDYQGNLLPALKKIITIPGSDILELGAGTGRLTSLLAPQARSLQAFDLSRHMLSVAARQLKTQGSGNWQVAVGDHRAIPRRGDSVDCVISGWSLCYLVVWEAEGWQPELNAALREIRRTLREDGRAVILETLGTGTETPLAPDELADYYRYLEQLGFQRSWIRTDYRFQDPAEARELVKFFFGQEMLARIGPEAQPTLPECTGIWWGARASIPQVM